MTFAIGLDGWSALSPTVGRAICSALTGAGASSLVGDLVRDLVRDPPRDAAGRVLLHASSYGSWITDQTHSVNGGCTGNQ